MHKRAEEGKKLSCRFVALPADLAVKPLLLLVLIGKNRHRRHADPSQQVVNQDHLLDAKLIEERPSVLPFPSHHRLTSPAAAQAAGITGSFGSSSLCSTASTQTPLYPRGSIRRHNNN
ncbi:MAG: hypothetical protein ACLQDM_10520 [Bradyrhizobium sp.]